MKICSLTSGSEGNCIYVATNHGKILVDVGISLKKLEKSLQAIEETLEDIQGILITHEHLDHIKGLGVITRKYNIPVYGTMGTLNILSDNHKYVGQLGNDLLRPIQADMPFYIHDMQIIPFHISHDAIEPVAYMMIEGQKKCTILTDLGDYDDYIVENIKNSNILFIETNHDIRMLQVGKYPYRIKQRILGDKGHLCNEAAGRLICEVLDENVEHIMLGHISKQNNYPELAYEAVKCEINLGDSPYTSNDFQIHIARQDEISKIVEI